VTPLLAAATCCILRPEYKAGVMELLLADGAAVNVKDNRGWTPLHYAAFWGHDDLVELLLFYGADPDAIDNDGATPFYYASDTLRSKVIVWGGRRGDGRLDRVNLAHLNQILRAPPESLVHGGFSAPSRVSLPARLSR
jgi:hypothetical protein